MDRSCCRRGRSAAVPARADLSSSIRSPVRPEVVGLFAVGAAHVTIRGVVERLPYPVYDVAIFNGEVDGGPEIHLEVPFLPYPGLVISLTMPRGKFGRCR